MKEFAVQLTDIFTRGLRRDSRSSHSEPGLTEVVNLRPTEHGLVSPEPLVNPFSLSISWPFPQLALLHSHALLLDKAAIYSLDASLFPTLLLDLSGEDDPVAPWSWADSWDYVLATNGSTVVEVTSAGASVVADGGNIPTPVGCLCAHPSGGQIFAGDLPSTWHGGRSNWVAWSKVGEADFTPDDSNLAGFAPMPFAGAVLAVRPLGDRVVVYGEDGIAVLTHHMDPVPTWGVTPIASVGLCGPGAVGGDLLNHVFVDARGDLWRLQAGGAPERLGYREFLAPLGADIMVSLDPMESEVYISGPETAYVLTRTGLGQVARGVTSCARVDDQLVAVATDLSDEAHRFTTDAMDMGVRGIKTLSAVEVGTSSPELAQVQVQPRYARHEDWQTTKWMRINKEGWAVPMVSGVEFRVACEFQGDSPSVDTDYMTIRWKMSDKRLVRGIYARS